MSNLGRAWWSPAVVHHRSGLGPAADDQRRRQLVLVYNGEILQLCAARDELRALGYTFRTTATRKSSCMPMPPGARPASRVSGMFAFALWTGRVGSCCLARDRLGASSRSIYAPLADGTLLFGSETEGADGLPAIAAANRPLRLRTTSAWLRARAAHDLSRCAQAGRRPHLARAPWRGHAARESSGICRRATTRPADVRAN